MLVKFFANKTGGSTSSIDYLLNKERVENGTARILKGDELLTRKIINSLTHKHKTCVGCLSFEEENIKEEYKKEIMESFENALLTPEMQDRYNILWVEHTDKNRLELNFVIPKVDLVSKKAFNPYYHQVDVKRVDLFTEYINLKYNFTNPKDPKKTQTLSGNKKAILIFKDYIELDKQLHQLVNDELITSREQLLEILKENNIEVTRAGADYISVKLSKNHKAKRLKGNIYNECFRSVEELNREYEKEENRAREYFQRDDKSELRRIDKELRECITRKSFFYAERNKKAVQKDDTECRAIQVKQSFYSNDLNSSNDNSYSDTISSNIRKAKNDRQQLDTSRERSQLHLHQKRANERNENPLLLSTELKKEQEEYDSIRRSIDERDRKTTANYRARQQELFEDASECERRIRASFYEERVKIFERNQELSRQDTEITRAVTRAREFIQDEMRRVRERIQLSIRRIAEQITRATELIKLKRKKEEERILLEKLREKEQEILKKKREEEQLKNEVKRTSFFRLR